MTYQYVCSNPDCQVDGIIEREARMSDGPPDVQCPNCLRPLRLLITGGAGIIFKGSGWTPRFGKEPLPPYDPEKDMESVDRQRREAGMEESDWKPKKAVHEHRETGINMPATKQTKDSA